MSPLRGFRGGFLSVGSFVAHGYSCGWRYAPKTQMVSGGFRDGRPLFPSSQYGIGITRLRGIIGLDEADLARAIRITTTAERLLTIENRKTTFRQIAERNANGASLVIATSYPTPGIKLLLSKLPADLPHWHFGDTDPYGFDIFCAPSASCACGPSIRS